MTPNEFLRRADEIRETRELNSWQQGDLNLYCRIVQRSGRVLPIDEYYLTIVGVPPRGYLRKLVPRVGKKITAKQPSLF